MKHTDLLFINIEKEEIQPFNMVLLVNNGRRRTKKLYIKFRKTKGR